MYTNKTIQKILNRLGLGKDEVKDIKVIEENGVVKIQVTCLEGIKYYKIIENNKQETRFHTSE